MTDPTTHTTIPAFPDNLYDDTAMTGHGLSAEQVCARAQAIPTSTHPTYWPSGTPAAPFDALPQWQRRAATAQAEADEYQQQLETAQDEAAAAHARADVLERNLTLTFTTARAEIQRKDEELLRLRLVNMEQQEVLHRAAAQLCAYRQAMASLKTAIDRAPASLQPSLLSWAHEQAAAVAQAGAAASEPVNQAAVAADLAALQPPSAGSAASQSFRGPSSSGSSQSGHSRGPHSRRGSRGGGGGGGPGGAPRYASPPPRNYMPGPSTVPPPPPQPLHGSAAAASTAPYSAGQKRAAHNPLLRRPGSGPPPPNWQAQW